jgi:hypothetical protein
MASFADPTHAHKAMQPYVFCVGSRANQKSQQKLVKLYIFYDFLHKVFVSFLCNDNTIQNIYKYLQLKNKSITPIRHK